MPCYEYYCEECMAIDEEYFSMSEMKKSIKCETCNGDMPRYMGNVGNSITGRTNQKLRKTEEAWMEKECDNIRNQLNHNGKHADMAASPYSTMAPDIDNLISKGTSNPVLQEQGLNYSRKDSESIQKTEEAVKVLNEKARDKSIKDSTFKQRKCD